MFYVLRISLLLFPRLNHYYSRSSGKQMGYMYGRMCYKNRNLWRMLDSVDGTVRSLLSGCHWRICCSWARSGSWNWKEDWDGNGARTGDEEPELGLWNVQPLIENAETSLERLKQLRNSGSNERWCRIVHTNTHTKAHTHTHTEAPSHTPIAMACKPCNVCNAPGCHCNTRGRRQRAERESTLCS